MSTTTATLCTCRCPKPDGTPCGKEFSGPDDVGAALLIGEKPQERTARFLSTLARHLALKHPEVIGRAQIDGGELVTLCLLGCFETQDMELLKTRDQLRHKIHTMTARFALPDETIRSRAGEIVGRWIDALVDGVPDSEESASLIDLVTDLFRELRDTLTEATLYPELHSHPEISSITGVS